MPVKKKAPLTKKSEKRKNTSLVKLKPAKKSVLRQADPELKINKIQDLQLKVIAHTVHNNFDGRKIDQLLRKNRRLWRAVMMTGNNLWPLRDMEENMWLADTLHILVREGYEYQLENLIREEFQADEVSWIGGNSAIETMGYWKEGIENNQKLVLSVWWD